MYMYILICVCICIVIDEYWNRLPTALLSKQQKHSFCYQSALESTDYVLKIILLSIQKVIKNPSLKISSNFTLVMVL